MSYESLPVENPTSNTAVAEPLTSDSVTAVPLPAHAAPAAPAVSAPRRLSDRFPNGVDLGVFAWMVIMHAGAIAAFWHFSWSALAVFFFLHWVSASLGICLGYHRLLTHGSLAVTRPVRYFFSLCGMLSAEGSPLMWVANHRKHHAHSDQEGDPHSPNDGFWWSHLIWFHPRRTQEEAVALYKRWAPDMYKDPVQRFFDRVFPIFSPIVGVGLYAAGEYFFQQGISWVLWGLCARLVVCYHCTWFVNSATHIWGYRNYETTDRSRNLWWVAILSYGEGWHNNHHAHQRLARHGHRWWEFDMSWWVICAWRKIGLVWDVIGPSEKLQQARALVKE